MSILNQENLQLPSSPKDGLTPKQRIDRLLDAWIRSSLAKEVLRKAEHPERSGGITKNVIKETNSFWAQVRVISMNCVCDSN
jgi:hypothetical protein